MTASSWAPDADTAANVAIIRRLLSDGFNQGNLAVCDELYSKDAVEHQRGNQSGADGVKAIITTLRSWFSDFRIEIEDVIAQDDMVWVRNRATGTNDGHFMGFPPTGRQIDITVYDTVRIRDGRIVEHWGVPDQLGAVLQLGHFPMPGGRQAGAATGTEARA